MQLIRHLRISRRTTCARGLVVLVAASALLVARNSSPRFSGPSVHSAAAGSHHEQRPRFDDNAPRCLEPSATIILAPPVEEQASLTFATALVPAFQTAGAHYNRPPPIL
jgi:hypothetical protein